MAPGAKISCPSDELLNAFLAGKAPAHLVPALAEHLDQCDHCRQRVLSAAKAFASTQGSKVSLHPHQAGQGDLIGRYVVLARLGSGAMGTVYVAFDPELERKVALKVLSGRGVGSKGRQLVGEAQALARLSHPNVVPVYDAGEHEGYVFIAMELVRGTTLREWSKTPRKPKEVLRLFSQFGLGIAAAHQAGLVHRDIKPENLLVGEDGRGRVSDFGLARLVEDPIESSTGSALIGTPAYMSPEQLDRKPADARSDQFSFCVTLYEALFGRRPFPGESLAELREQMRERAAIPLKVGVPLATRQAILRGLSEDPAQRFPHLEQVRARLELTGVWPRRIAVSLALLLGAGAVAAATLRFAQPQEAPRPCAGAERLLQGTWDPARSSALIGALKKSASGAARESADVVKAELDLWARDWVAERTAACEATRVRKEQSEQMLDRRVACLDRRLEEVRALLEVLQWGQAEVADRAVQAVEAITPVAVCADTGTLLDVTPMPAGTTERQRVNEALQRLSRAKAVLDSAQPTQALEESKLAVAAAADAGYPPLEAEARLQLGLAYEAEGQHAEAAQLDADAFSLANGAHDDRTAARAAAHAYRETGRAEATRPVSAVWKTVARSSVARTRDDPALLGELTYFEAFTAYDAADFKTAATRFEAACELYLKAFGPSVDLGNCLVRAGEAWVQAGDFAQAEERCARGLALLTQRLGAEHPQVAEAQTRLAIVYINQGDLDRALTFLRPAVETSRRIFPRGHPGRFDVSITWAYLSLERGEVTAALEAAQEAFEISQSESGTERQRAGARAVLAEALRRSGRPKEAVEHGEAALRWRSARYGPDSPALLTDYDELSQTYLALGEQAKARAALQKAAAIADTAPTEYLFGGRAHLYLGRALAKGGKADRAKAAQHLDAAEALFGHLSAGALRTRLLDEVRAVRGATSR